MANTAKASTYLAFPRCAVHGRDQEGLIHGQSCSLLAVNQPTARDGLVSLLSGCLRPHTEAGTKSLKALTSSFLTSSGMTAKFTYAAEFVIVCIHALNRLKTTDCYLLPSIIHKLSSPVHSYLTDRIPSTVIGLVHIK